MQKVYVINKHGRPLMPCSPAKARHLLDDGKAKVQKGLDLPVWGSLGLFFFPPKMEVLPGIVPGQLA